MKKRLQHSAMLLLIVMSSFILPHEAKAQQTISGRVTNASGEPLISASVINRNSKQSTVTNATGNFSIAAKDGDMLDITFIGKETQHIKVSGTAPISVMLSESVDVKDEVVVIGYGTQKKINQTGAVASVSGPELVKRPSPNVQNLLQGRVAGLDVIQSTGQPGRDNATILIRGQGSFGSSSAPLILVDGVIGSINNLSPSDIENVSILKDAASASIYGARAANGVILVTTKKGKSGQTTLEYGVNVGTSSATALPDLVYNSVQYMEMRNQASKRVGRPDFYTSAQIDAYRNATDKNKYPDFNWMDYAFNPASTINHHLGFSGGTDKTVYNLSFNYLTQDGIMKKNDYKRYNALLDFSTQVHKRVRVGANINFSYQNITEPWLTNDGLVLIVYHSAPTFGPFLPDGSGRVTSTAYPGESSGQRSYSSIINNGAQYTKNYNVNAQAFALVDLAKGLSLNVKGALTYFNQDFRNHQFGVPTYYYQPDASGTYQYFDNSSPNFLGVNQSFNQSLTKTAYATLNYETKFGSNHGVKALAGYEQQNNSSPSLSGARRNFPNNTLMELNAGSAAGQTTSGNTTEWALQSLFGRINYDYKGKYLLEGNIRYDGTSRVAPDNRWGLFGGGSAGWRISEESLIKDNLPWLSNLKLRASYGVLGNQELANNFYPYQDLLPLTVYPFGTTLNQGALLTRLIDKKLRWESTRGTDIGLEFEIMNGLLSGTIDYYTKKTKDILAARQDVPASVGLSAPTTNAGAMENKGWEFELRHNNKIGDFTYGANFLMAINRNKVTKVLAPNKGVFEEGLPFNSLYVYEWAGIFQSQEEIDKWAKQPNSGVLRPGDLKIKDQNGNGTVGPEDRISISPFADFTYSFGANAGWKGFSLSIFFQGVEGRKLYVTGWGVEPFGQGAPPPKKFLNAWTPENRSQTIPAIYLDRAGYAGVQGYNSTYFLQDASYLRLKSVYLSYQVPANITNRIHSKGLTVYVSGDNLATWTKYEGADPERAGGGNFSQFPQLKTFTAGLNIKF